MPTELPIIDRHGAAGYRHGCRCAECRQAVRAHNATYRAAHQEAERARHAAYHAAHREADREAARAYSAAHPDAERARDAAYSDSHREEKRTYRAAHREERAVYNRAYYATHREGRTAYMMAWAAAHPEMRAPTDHRRRARLAGVESEPFTLADVIARAGWRCGICGGEVSPNAQGWDRLSMDPL